MNLKQMCYDSGIQRREHMFFRTTTQRRKRMSKNAQTGMVDVPKYGDLRDLMVSEDTRAARQKAVEVAEKVVQNSLHEETDEN